jgi:hypothetical protein
VGLAEQIKDAGCKPEDAEMRSARHAIRARGNWESII